MNKPSFFQKPARFQSRKKSRALLFHRSGTFDIDSVPPATMRSVRPSARICHAENTASIPEAQFLFTV